MSENQVSFSMIKPDATARNLIGTIIQKFESENLKLKAGRLTVLNRSLCETFYEEHREKSFFRSLVEFVLSGPVFVMAMSGKDSVKRIRDIMGHTDPAKAKANTIRALYGESIERNSVHGSDSLESAKREISLFFEQESWK